MITKKDKSKSITWDNSEGKQDAIETQTYKRTFTWRKYRFFFIAIIAFLILISVLIIIAISLSYKQVGAPTSHMSY